MKKLKNTLTNSILLAQTAHPLNERIEGPEGPFNVEGLGNSALRTLFNQSISFLIGFLTVLGSLFFLFQIFIGALGWINAGGNEKNIADARQKIINAILGLIVLVAAYAIISLVSELIGINTFDPLNMFVNGTTAPSCSGTGTAPSGTDCSSNPNICCNSCIPISGVGSYCN